MQRQVDEELRAARTGLREHLRSLGLGLTLDGDGELRPDLLRLRLPRPRAFGGTRAAIRQALAEAGDAGLDMWDLRQATTLGSATLGSALQAMRARGEIRTEGEHRHIHRA